MARVDQTMGKFRLQETTITDIQSAFSEGGLSARQLAEFYLNRIEAYDRDGPKINSIITVNPNAIEQAERLDIAFGQTGVGGPLHGIPVILKDQMDARGMPTTLGSVLFENYFPDRDSFVVEKLKKAGVAVHSINEDLREELMLLLRAGIAGRKAGGHRSGWSWLFGKLPREESS